MRLKRMTGGAIASPSWLTSKLLADPVIGSHVKILTLLDDAVLSGTDVESIPSRVGLTWAPNGAHRFTARAVNGRRSMVAPDTTVPRAMLYDGPAGYLYPNAIIVAGMVGLPLAAGVYTTLYTSRTSTAGWALVGNAGTSDWLTIGAEKRYIDGTEVTAMTAGAGLHLIQCHGFAIGAADASQLGGYSGNDDRSWTNDICAIIRFDATPTAAQIYASCSPLLRRYYRLA